MKPNRHSLNAIQFAAQAEVVLVDEASELADRHLQLAQIEATLAVADELRRANVIAVLLSPTHLNGERIAAIRVELLGPDAPKVSGAQP